MTRGYADCGGRLVHFRRAGSGPPVVLLHDSPRSSVLHLPLLAEFSDAFTVYAPDTPGYGQSDPLPAAPRPEIDDFGDALAATLRALGLEGAAVYAYHTSSKIALACAIRHPGLIGRLVIDGISLPRDPVPEDFIAAYMSPFEVDAEGAYIGTQWTRIRDLHRFFPWFRRSGEARIPMDEPTPEAMHAYAMDLFMAGPHYSSAYAAAMRYRALEVLPRLGTPTTFMARASDVLHGYLDTVEACLPACAEVLRLPADDAVWRARLRTLFAGGTGLRRAAAPRPAASPSRCRRRYLSLNHGQMHLHEYGSGGQAVVVLHDPPGSGRDAATLAEQLGGFRVLAPDLPGCAASDPLPARPSAGDYAAALWAMADAEQLGSFAVVALGLSVPIAVALAADRAGRVTRLVTDGMPLLDERRRRNLADRYAPSIRPTRDGSHFMATWHRLRDEELQFPWYDGSRHAARRVEPELDGRRLHERLVATLMQPERYGDACRAALDCDLEGLCGRLTMPVLALDAEGDPRSERVQQWRASLPDGRRAARPAAAESRARLIRDFLRESC